MLGLTSSLHSRDYFSGVQLTSPSTKSISFDGIGDYLLCDSTWTDDVFKGSFTICAWIRMPDPVPGSFKMWWGCVGSSGAIYLGPHNNSNAYFWFGADGSAANHVWSGWAPSGDGDDTGWFLIAKRVVIGATSMAYGTRKLSLNDGSISSSTANPNRNKQQNFAAGLALGIGTYNQASGAGGFAHDWDLAEFAVWSTDLDDKEITQIHGSEATMNLLQDNADYESAGQLECWYNFEQGNTGESAIKDQSGNDRHATTFGDPTFISDTPSNPL